MKLPEKLCPHMMAATCTICQRAADVLQAWEAWCGAEGWDNNEYDALGAALNRLAAVLKVEID